MPLTICGGRFSRLLIRSVSGTSMRRVLAIRIAAPRRQVQIITAISDAEQQRHPGAFEQLQQIGGEEASCRRRRSGTITAAAVAARQFHNFQITTKPMMPSTTMVVETAMP